MSGKQSMVWPVIKASVLLPLIGYVAFLTIDIQKQSELRSEIALDLAELDHIKYGVFDVSTWAEIGAQVALTKVDQFELTPRRRDDLLPLIESALYNLMNSIDEAIGRLSTMKQQVASIALKEHIDPVKIPTLARTILSRLETKLSEPETRQQLRRLLETELNLLRAETHTKVDRSVLIATMAKHGCTHRYPCRAQIAHDLDLASMALTHRSNAVLALSLFILLCCFIVGSPYTRLDLTLLALLSGVLWYGGISMPMLDVEAKLGALSIVIAGEAFTFANQLVFYQSKSIIDFVLLMVRSGQLDVMIVGLLIGLFSVIFPFFKLLCTGVCALFSRASKRSKVIQFFALKSGKWSMADVMVVSIFMAYIGFSRLIHTQLSQIGAQHGDIDVLTTNGTGLQVGFYFFLAFCLLGLVLSSILGRLDAQTDQGQQTQGNRAE
ncbi:MAG: hypothetical protein CMH52_14025 [Myxococcales bacterium]|nr:hypothetical protein [Myxococcales bacterium]